MAETVSAVVSEILAQGSFDLSSPEALAILNRRHKEMVTQARAYRTVGTMTRPDPGSPGYALPAGLLDLMQIMAVTTPSDTSTTVQYTAAIRSDIPEMLAGTLATIGDDGLFAEYAGNVYLYPDPGVAATVFAYGVFDPPDLLIDNSVPFRVDSDMIEGLMAGVFASALRRPGEARPDLASDQEALFQAAVDKFRRRVTRRYRGSGPAQIRLTGPQYT